MTSEQSQKFDLYGCACRCLIALANAKGNNITKEKFIAEFSTHPEFWFWETQKQWGLTNTGLLLDLIRALHLGSSFHVFLNKDEVRRRMDQNSVAGVLLITEKMKHADGSFTDYYHCSVIAPARTTKGEFQMVNITTDLKQSKPIPLNDLEVDELKGYFVIIEPEREQPVVASTSKQ